VICSFSISFLLTPLSGILALKLGLVDRPNERKIHKLPTPLLGGMAVFLGFIGGVLLNGIFQRPLLTILFAGSIIFIMGAVDDFKELPGILKLFVQIFSVVYLIYNGIVLRVLPNAWGLVSDILNIILTIIWIVGITNALNFFDGMDGLAAGLSIILSFFLGIVAFQTMQPFLGWISISILGASAGFLPYNLRIRGGDAKIFLGDAGSTFLGFVLASLAVYGDWCSYNPIVAVASPLLIFWILIFDMTYITVERIATGKVSTFKEWIDYVGKDHLHHRLYRILKGKRKTVFFIYLLAMTLCINAVVLRNARTIDALLLLFQAVLIVTILTILERHES